MTIIAQNNIVGRDSAERVRLYFNVSEQMFAGQQNWCTVTPVQYDSLKDLPIDDLRIQWDGEVGSLVSGVGDDLWKADCIRRAISQIETVRSELMGKSGVKVYYPIEKEGEPNEEDYLLAVRRNSNDPTQETELALATKINLGLKQGYAADENTITVVEWRMENHTRQPWTMLDLANVKHLVEKYFDQLTEASLQAKDEVESGAALTGFTFRDRQVLDPIAFWGLDADEIAATRSS